MAGIIALSGGFSIVRPLPAPGGLPDSTVLRDSVAHRPIIPAQVGCKSSAAAGRAVDRAFKDSGISAPPGLDGVGVLRVHRHGEEPAATRQSQVIDKGFFPRMRGDPSRLANHYFQ